MLEWCWQNSVKHIPCMVPIVATIQGRYIAAATAVCKGKENRGVRLKGVCVLIRMNMVSFHRWQPTKCLYSRTSKFGQPCIIHRKREVATRSTYNN